MRLLLAGMTLACLGQAAHAQTRYLEEPPAAEASASPVPATPAADPQFDAAALFNNQPEPAAAAATEPAAQPATAPATPPAANPFTVPPPAADLNSVPATPPPAAADATQRSLLVAGPKPTKLMQELMKAPAGAPLAGTPITLAEAVRDSRSRQDQTQRAKAYWDLAAAVGDYYLAVHEAQELDAFRAGIAAPGAQWNVRQTDMKTRIDAARLAAQTAQLQLHALLGGSELTTPPIPADIPHCGRYNAEYDEIFASRPDPVAKKLAAVLALRHSELRSMTQAVEDAQARVNQAVAARGSHDDGTDLLNAQQLLSLQRRAFVARAREYNQEIAAYTELAAPADVATDRLVAMMIRTSMTVNPLRWGQGEIEPVVAEEPAAPTLADGSAATSDNGVQPTFHAEQQRRTEVRRPLQRLLGRDREQSIVVKRLRNLIDRE